MSPAEALGRITKLDFDAWHVLGAELHRLRGIEEQLESVERELRNAERMAAAIVYASPENKVRVYPLHLRADVVLERADELDDTIVFRSVLREAYNAQPEDADGQPLALGEPPETYDPGAPESAHVGGSDSFPAKNPLRKPGRSSECGHDGWQTGCPVCEREERDALRAMGEPSPAGEPK